MIQTVPLRCPNCSNVDRVEFSALKFGFEFQCKYCATTSVLAINNQLIIPSAGERICANCGNVNPSSTEVCTCGAPLTRACVNPDCRRTFPVYHQACDFCGFPQHVDPNSPAGATIRGQLALRELMSKNSQVRRRGAQKLARLGKRAAFAAPYIVPLVKRDPINACYVLCEMGDAGAPAVPPLIELLRYVDEDTSVQSAACRALAAIGAPAREALPALAQVITKAGSAKINTYTSLVADAFTAIMKISALTGVRATTPTLKALIAVLQNVSNTTDDGVLRDVCAALESMGAKALPAEAALADIFRYHSGARWAAWSALETIERATPELLVDALRLRSDDPDVICERLAAMGDLAAPAVAQLIAVIDDPLQPDYARQAAYSALGRIGVPSVAPLLELVKKSGTDQTVDNVSYTLAVIGQPALQPLIRALKTEGAEVQYTACLALGKMGGQASDALPALKSIIGLTSVLTFKPSRVKEAARDAIKRIQQPT